MSIDLGAFAAGDREVGARRTGLRWYVYRRGQRETDRESDAPVRRIEYQHSEASRSSLIGLSYIDFGLGSTAVHDFPAAIEGLTTS